MVLINDIVFKSTVSRWIVGLYWCILIFLGVLFIGISLLSPITFFQVAIFVVVFFMVFLIIIATLVRAYRFIFIISNDRLILAGLLKKHEIIVDAGCNTSISGLFAAGDVTSVSDCSWVGMYRESFSVSL
jgi:hypothetical protein